VKRNISIVDFVTDPQLLGLSISTPQETLLRAIYGLPLTKSMLKIWQRCTGREIYRISPNEVKGLKKRVASSRSRSSSARVSRDGTITAGGA
jgi:hypothetical protein